MQLTLKLYIFCKKLLFHFTSDHIKECYIHVRLCAVLCWGCLKAMDWDIAAVMRSFPSARNSLNQWHHSLWILLINIVIDLRVDIWSGVSTKLTSWWSSFSTIFQLLKDHMAAATTASDSMCFIYCWLTTLQFMRQRHVTVLSVLGSGCLYGGCAVLLTEYADNLYLWGQ